MEDVPCLSPWQHMSTATRLLEHAVSMVMLGPVRSKKVLILLDNMLAAIPVPAYFGAVSRSFAEARV